MGDGNNNMSSNDTKANTPQECKIPSAYYDPIDIKVDVGQEITIKDDILFMTNETPKNQFRGYYGYGRISKNGLIINHDGYDYLAEVEKTDVKAVHHGYITKIRLGHNDGTNCALKDFFFRTRFLSFKQEFFDNNSPCKNCDNVSGCYGFQVFFEIAGTNYFAYYAHLSEIDNSVIEKMKISTCKFNDANNTLIFSPAIELCGGDIIGKSGDTGNASLVLQKHLHFECRIGNGSKVSPNKIVKTEFKIKSTKDPNKPLIEEIKETDIIEYRKDIIKKLEEEWGKTETFKARDSFIKTIWSSNKNYKKVPWEQFKRSSEYKTIYDEQWKGNPDENGMREIDKAWEKYKVKKIKDKWKTTYRVQKESNAALIKFRDEHIIVVGNIKGSENNTIQIVS